MARSAWNHHWYLFSALNSWKATQLLLRFWSCLYTMNWLQSFSWCNAVTGAADSSCTTNTWSDTCQSNTADGIIIPARTNVLYVHLYSFCVESTCEWRICNETKKNKCFQKLAWTDRWSSGRWILVTCTVRNVASDCDFEWSKDVQFCANSYSLVTTSDIKLLYCVLGLVYT